MAKKKEVIIYTDGFMKSKQEPEGGCSLKFVVDGKDFIKGKFYFSGISFSSLREYIKTIPHTNNVSEYFAMAMALYNAESYSDISNKAKVIIHSDSEVIVNQLNDYYECSAEHLIPLYNFCKVIYNRMGKRLIVQWITRDRIVKELGH
jgi:ribonuclease HI